MIIKRQDEDYMMAASQYRQALEKLSEAKTDLGIAKDRLLSLNPDDVAMSGFGASIKPVLSKGSVDYKAIVNKYLPDIEVEDFRKDDILSIKITATKIEE